MHAAEVIEDHSAQAAFRLSHFLLKAFVSRVIRRIPIHFAAQQLTVNVNSVNFVNFIRGGGQSRTLGNPHIALLGI